MPHSVIVKEHGDSPLIAKSRDLPCVVPPRCPLLLHPASTLPAFCKSAVNLPFVGTVRHAFTDMYAEEWHDGGLRRCQRHSRPQNTPNLSQVFGMQTGTCT